MRPLELIRLVWLNIVENKFKVILTSIGIIVGAATIALVIAVGRGGRMDVEDQFKNLNAASIEITTGSSSSSRNAAGRATTQSGGGMPSGGAPAGGSMPSGGGAPAGGGMPPSGNMPGGFQGGMFGGMPNLQTVNATLTEEDAEDILFFVPNVASSTISASGRASVLGGNLEEEESYTVAGVKPEYALISNLSLYLGDFIIQQDEDDLAKNCVLGYAVATTLFDSVIDAYDATITIDDTSFAVVGVLQSMGSVSSGINPDDAIYIPYSTGMKYLFGRDASPQITVVATDIQSVAGVMENLNTLLNENYPGATFTISDAGSKMEAASKSSETLTMLLGAVAIIVFALGGIGIMNVLFLSIKERTKEIGVLKALGMSKGSILTEFLLEATMISILGGLLGIALSFGINPIAEHLGTRMEPLLSDYGIAFGFAVLTGTVFGIYPAIKASRLIPVRALNQE